MRYEKFVKMIKERKTNKEISKELGMSVPKINRSIVKLRKSGVNLPKRRENSKLSQEEVDKLNEILAE